MLLLFAVTIAIIGVRDLFSVVVLNGVYSFLMATVLVSLDAVDVAMTEAAVGAGISTVLLLGTLHLTNTNELRPNRRPIVPFIASIVVAGALVYATFDLPRFGTPDAPQHKHVAPTYLKEAPEKTTVPNVVTAVLASYRGFDTLGEVTVVFTAGIGVLALLHGRRRREEETEGQGREDGR